MTDAETILSLRTELARVTAKRDELAVGNLKAQHAAAKRNANLIEEISVLRAQYNELIFAVVNKYDNETRHQTALRIIRLEGRCVSEMSQSQIERCECRLDGMEPSRDCPVHRGA